MVLGATVLFGVTASVLVRPIFVSRYMIVAVGCFWFCYAWMIGKNRKKKVLVAFVLALSAVICFINFGQFVRWEHKKKGYYEETSKVIRQIDGDDIVLAEGEHMQGCLSWYLDGREILPIEELKDISEIMELSEGTVIWCFDTENGENIQTEEIKDEYSEVEELGQYHLEYDTFSVTKLIM